MVAEVFGNDEEGTYAICLENIKAGCTVTVTAPSGEEWTHEHVTAVLTSRGFL